jgi:hypothetical protein
MGDNLDTWVFRRQLQAAGIVVRSLGRLPLAAELLVELQLGFFTETRRYVTGLVLADVGAGRFPFLNVDDVFACRALAALFVERGECDADGGV